MRLDRSVRKALEVIICTGFATFPLSCTGELDYDNANDLVLEIDQQQMRLRTLNKDGNDDINNSFTTNYSVTYPKIILHTTDSKKLCFVLNDGNTELSASDLAYNRKLLVNCLNQQNRDLIVLSIRVFALRNSLKIGKLLESFSDEFGKVKTDVFLELENTIKELYSVNEENSEMRKVMNQQKKENKALAQTIENYKSQQENYSKNLEIIKQFDLVSDKNLKYKTKIIEIKKDLLGVKEKYEQSLQKEKALMESLEE